MTARRHHYPGRAPNTGTAGTPAAYDPCAGCRHARVKHVTGPAPGCSVTVLRAVRNDKFGDALPAVLCACPGFKEE